MNVNEFMAYLSHTVLASYSSDSSNWKW